MTIDHLKKVSFLLSIIPGPCPASLPGGPVRMAFGLAVLYLAVL